MARGNMRAPEALYIRRAVVLGALIHLTDLQRVPRTAHRRAAVWIALERQRSFGSLTGLEGEP